MVVARFYAHESCGQCTPCRESTGWIYKMAHRIVEGKGRKEDLDTILDVAKRGAGHHHLRLLRRRGRALHQLHREVPRGVRGADPERRAMPKLDRSTARRSRSPAGTNLIEAARQAGVEVPHYCYHPGLTIAGQCRLCMVDIEKVPRPQIGCNTPAADGMVVHTQTERVLETRRSIMEFHLDQPPARLPGVRPGGRVLAADLLHEARPLRSADGATRRCTSPRRCRSGPHVILDAERCILCSRCVRFCDEVTGTGELGIFHRGDHSEIGLFPGKTLENKYSGNVIDICPVGALTDRDFRFQVRVWYLDTAKSRLQRLRARLQHRDPHEPPAPASQPGPARGAAQAALQCRRQPVVDLRRGPLRLRLDRRRDPAHRAAAREGGRAVETTWDEALAALGAALRRYRPEEIGILASPQMSNEDLFALKRLADQLATSRTSTIACLRPIPGTRTTS